LPSVFIFPRLSSEDEIHRNGGMRSALAPMLRSRMVSEISYSPNLGNAFRFILQDPSLSSSPERPSLQFITAARFLKNHAPHLFQIREMGAQSENRMDRWLWDLLN
jgi:hypothetical protein